MAEIISKPKVHHGHNLKVIRETRGHKQDSIAHIIGCSQPYIAKLESTAAIAEDTLRQFAEIYRVDIDLLKDMQIEPDKLNITIENNSFGSGSIVGQTIEIGEYNNNSYEDMLRISHEKEALYQQLGMKDQEKITVLMRHLVALEKRIEALEARK